MKYFIGLLLILTTGCSTIGTIGVKLNAFGVGTECVKENGKWRCGVTIDPSVAKDALKDDWDDLIGRREDDDE